MTWVSGKRDIIKATPGLPGASVVKTLPANAGNTGSIPGPGPAHMPWSNSVPPPNS